MAFLRNEHMQWIHSNTPCKVKNCHAYPYFAYTGNALILYCDGCDAVYFEPISLTDNSEPAQLDWEGRIVNTDIWIVNKHWRTATHEEIQHSQWASYEGQTIEVKESNFK